VALLTQIVATGKNAFMTAKGSKAVDDFVSQLDVWTNAETGIIPLLNMHAPEFKDNPIKSTYTSVITSVRGWVQAESHLYTSGNRQGAPQAVQRPQKVVGFPPSPLTRKVVRFGPRPARARPLIFGGERARTGAGERTMGPREQG